MFRTDIFRRYLEVAPAALALERTIESRILAEQAFERPILDVGCGDGVFATVVFDEKIDTGIDYDPEEIERARQWAAYEELIVCPGAAIPKPDQAYRTVFSNSVLEHIPDVAAVLREVHRVLAVGGRFYITIPTDRLERYSFVARILLAFGLSGLQQKFAAFYNRFWKHYHAYPEERWRQLFAEAGFRVVEERSYVSRNVSTLYDVLTPFGLFAMISKKRTGRWIAFPAIRRSYVGLLQAVLAPSLNRIWADRGALVFYALTRD
jgi:ubiquinone/menaquinone biosynthesis C-methylase UbiE